MPNPADRRVRQPSFPHQDGFKMPAEWEPHKATWLAWPHNQETWPGRRLDSVRETFMIMMEGLLPHEQVHLLHRDAREFDGVSSALKKRGIKTGNLIPHIAETADAWVRDYGPTFVRNQNGRKAWCKWVFNAWGGKYPELACDNRIFEAGRNGIREACYEADFVLEGGSIEVNGKATCLTTEPCLLNPNRNPRLSRDEIETKLRQYLGVSQILWLEAGIAGDDTDGHIDNLSRFVNEDTIVTVMEDNAAGENFQPLKKNLKKIESSRTPEGKPWNVTVLPMPGEIRDEGVRRPASYANFYIANQCVLLPVYGHRHDARAASVLSELFPGREIIPVPGRELVYGLGSVHCVTQQEPA
ncbi:MAG: hypothetical protein A2Z83_04085 [Omnitrophica bacterium GWA2_52_8]|nr:MAG: hypothetical protein A2Z83_04085 [Omnitrophica bacterium GWA2_52_8]